MKKTANKEQEIRVKSLISGALADPNYPGIFLDIEDADGCIVPLVTAEIVDGKLNLYVYSDPRRDDYTHKFSYGLMAEDKMPPVDV